jgi:aconitate hydratase
LLGLTFATESDYDKIQEDDTINFIDLVDFAPGKPLTLEFVHTDGTTDSILANHTYNEGQIGWFAGSALNLISSGKRINQTSYFIFKTLRKLGRFFMYSSIFLRAISC